MNLPKEEEEEEEEVSLIGTVVAPKAEAPLVENANARAIHLPTEKRTLKTRRSTQTLKMNLPCKNSS